MTIDLTFGQQSRPGPDPVAENNIQVTVYDVDKGQPAYSVQSLCAQHCASISTSDCITLKYELNVVVLLPCGTTQFDQLKQVLLFVLCMHLMQEEEDEEEVHIRLTHNLHQHNKIEGSTEMTSVSGNVLLTCLTSRMLANQNKHFENHTLVTLKTEMYR